MAAWQWLRRNRQVDQDLQDEIRAHLAMAEHDRMADGEDREAARLAALKEFGNVTLAVEAGRRERRGRLLEYARDVAQDVRYGLRLLARNPGFTIISVVSLAIGIGATCAVFSFADALLLRPLTVPRAGDVVTVGTPDSMGRNLVASYREYVDVRARSQSFDGLVAFATATVAFGADANTLPKLRMGMLVSDNFFPVIGVEPQLGRTFGLDENKVPGRDAVVMLGHDFWKQQFGADRSGVGRTVSLNGIDFTVVGVAPAEFTGLEQHTRFDFYAPLMMWARLMTDPRVQPFEVRDYRSLTLKGRLKAGVTTSRAQTELSVIARDLERTYPETNRNRTLAVRTELQTRIAQAPPLARLVMMLTTLAIAVLLVACANVAGLLTSRAPVRAREIALRLAIGAGRRRVIRQLITESVLIATIGGVLALGVGYAGVMVFRQFQIPTDLPIVPAFELDRRALICSLVVALVSALLFGLAPAIRATRGDLTAVMKATDAAAFGRRGWGRAVLVSGQVAVSVVLLVVATLMYRNFRELLAGGPGYRPDHLLQMSFVPTLVRYTGPQARRFFEQVAERARSVPGVKSVSLASAAPSDIGPGSARTIAPEGFQLPAVTESVAVLSSIVDEHYFDTVGLSILEGRGFRTTDADDAPRVAVVNERLAQLYWPGHDALGKRFRLYDATGPWVEVVGVAKTAKYIVLSESPRALVYLAYKQHPQPRMTMLVESVGDPGSLAAPLREMVRRFDANLPIDNVRTVEESYRMRMVSIFHVIIELVGAMGTMGLGLAIVGLYGLVAYAASRRTKEIGIRMAIGADQADVLRMVLRQGTVLAVVGLGAGLLASVVASRALTAFFPRGASGDGGTDVAAFVLVASAVLLVTLLAAYVPARRASRVNPTDALR